MTAHPGFRVVASPCARSTPARRMALMARLLPVEEYMWGLLFIVEYLREAQQ
ncbi:hypothetical protein [Streptomyces sp. NPDC057636]|uniref:hypothetical protein n=1 Tax=Streptomyces sp. NPDC057636 TaxID=3346189 RepID=UPI0036B1A660